MPLSRPLFRIEPTVFGLTLLLAAACFQLPSEFGHYRRWLELSADETGLRIAVLMSLLAKTLIAMATGFLMLLLATAWMRASLLRLGAILLATVTIGIISSDLTIQRSTGNSLATYIPYLFEPDTSVWAGEGLGLWPALRQVGGQVFLAIGVGSLCAWIVEKWIRRGGHKRARSALWFLVVVFLTVCIAAPVSQRLCGSPMTIGALANRLIWPGTAGLLAPVDPRNTAQVAIQESFKQALPALSFEKPVARRNFDVMPITDDMSGDPVDVLVVVVESLRADALNSTTMPRNHAWSKKGTRFDHHYSTSNASHYGLFAILYGESPLRYFDAMAYDEVPILASVLRSLGYTTHLLSCGDFKWRGMERFMGPPHFDVEQFSEKSLDECDQKAATRAAALLSDSRRRPRFVVLFLLSTHFGYSFPSDMSPFRPFLNNPNALDIDPARDREELHNRYRNSAHYVDSITGELIEKLDLDRTLVILTGDHGEALFDDGTLSHASRLSESQTRVPLIMAGPGVPAGKVHRSPTDHTDIARTMISRILPKTADLSDFPGRDLVSGEPREFITLVHAKANSVDLDQIALVSDAGRMGVRLDRVRSFAQFTGKMGLDGRRQRQPLSREDSRQASDWFDDYLSEVTRHSEPR